MAANRTQIIAGWCVQRMQHGEQWAWMIVVLAAMLGQIGLPGGGFGFGWHYNGAGTPGRKGVILSGFSGSTSIPPVHDNSDYKGYSSTIPIARFIDAILEPGKVINWNGKSVKLPPLKMCIFAGTNPFHRHQQINRIIEGWRSWKRLSPSITSGPQPAALPISCCLRPRSLSVTISTSTATTPIVASSP